MIESLEIDLDNWIIDNITYHYFMYTSLFVVIFPAFACFSLYLYLELNISLSKEKVDLIATSSEEMLKLEEQLHSVKGELL